MNQALLELDPRDYQDRRGNQVSQGSQEVQDLKEHQDHPVSQVFQEGQGPKVTPGSQDSKVHPVAPVLRVLTVGSVAQVSPELPVDRENPVDQEDQGSQETRARQVGTASRDRPESKETQGFLVMVDPALLGFPGCQVRRETRVFPAHLGSTDSQDPKETPVSPDLLALQATPVQPGLQDRFCRAPKDSKDPLGHQGEEAPLALRVPEGPQEAAALRERRALPALLDSPASLDRRETAAFPGSQAPLVSLEVQVKKETSVFLAFLDSPGRRATWEPREETAFLETLEVSDFLALLVNPASFGIPVNTREPEEPPGFRARLVVEDFPAPPAETDVQVSLVKSGPRVQRVLPASAAHPAGREITDQLVSPVSVASLVPPVQTALRVSPALRDRVPSPTAS